MTQNVLVTGGTGLLGQDVLTVFSEAGYTVHNISRRSIPDRLVNHWKGDLTDNNFLRSTLRAIDPSIIVHCAAYVDLEYCELNKDSVDSLHVAATQELASYKPTETRFIYISTDAVFDGKDGNYSEDSPVRPLNYYSKSKLAAEHVAMSHNVHSLVVRTNIYGFHQPVGNSLLEWALAGLMRGKQINGFDDVLFNPLYTKQLATIILEFSQNSSQVRGVLHAGCRDQISKFMFLRSVAAHFGLHETLVQRSSIGGSQVSVARPMNTTLNLQKLSSHIAEIPTLEAGLICLYSDYKNTVGNKSNI